jgi:hypothetical protein
LSEERAITLDYTFRDAVAVLERMLNEHQARLPKGKRVNPERSTA